MLNYTFWGVAAASTIREGFMKEVELKLGSGGRVGSG